MAGAVVECTERPFDQVVQFLGSAYGAVSPDGEAHFPVVIATIGVLMTTEPHLDRSDLRRCTLGRWWCSPTTT
jgi:hypothetical protein